MKEKLNKKLYEYKKLYGYIYTYFSKHLFIKRLLVSVYKYIPYVTVTSYLGMIAYSVMAGNCNQTLRIIVIPAITFSVITIIRKIINRKRPYVECGIKPIINKEKAGESFPSRHTLSAGIIAMAGIYFYLPLGVFLWIITLIIAISRVLAGVHYPSDIIAAILLSILFGLMFFI